METRSTPLALLVMSGPAQGQRILLDRPVMLGRDPKSKIPIDDARVSRHHSLLEMTSEGLVVRDLGSKNGTFVNGREIKEPFLLRPSDRVRIGKTLFAIVAAKDEGLEGAVTASVETAADPPFLDSDDPLPSTADAQINRRTLRHATDFTARLAALRRTRYPLPAIVSAIRKEFRADGAGIFTFRPTFEALCIDGELPLPNGAQEAIFNHCQAPNQQSATFLTPDTVGYEHGVLLFPIIGKDDLIGVFVLRRDGSRPFEATQLQFADALAECLRMLSLESILTTGKPSDLPDHLGIIGSSDSMAKVRAQLRQYAATSSTVLIRGESGTGKELCARALMQLSQRRFGPYVEVNSATLMPELMEAELFGHERGAFTSAVDRRIGKLELADGGTLFLDEIGEIPVDLQAKLLRVLEGQPFYRLGGSELVYTDVRFISATNRNLEHMVNIGTFRADLYHRINILRLDLPPLRDHLEDVPELITYLIAQIQEEYKGTVEYTISPIAYRYLLSHSWPGNVRELRNVLERTILLSNSSIIDEKMLPPELASGGSGTTLKMPRLQVLTEMMEREEITRALVECRGHKSAAAKMLGISRPTLDKKIKFYGLSALASSRSKGEGDFEESDEPDSAGPPGTVGDA